MQVFETCVFTSFTTLAQYNTYTDIVGFEPTRFNLNRVALQPIKLYVQCFLLNKIPTPTVGFEPNIFRVNSTTYYQLYYVGINFYTSILPKNTVCLQVFLTFLSLLQLSSRNIEFSFHCFQHKNI